MLLDFIPECHKIFARAGGDNGWAIKCDGGHVDIQYGSARKPLIELYNNHKNKSFFLHNFQLDYIYSES